ncbi:MAG TPA: ankyrin repeat domain-containing protein [Bryobacteraceae bacterium]|nr:ankyrin repeat domain-containing protein [Bryobacteraceae bacterium]
MHKIAVYIIVLSACLGAAVAQTPSERFYQAIRNNDAPALAGLVKNSGVNTRDERGSTPLMYAAAFGSLDSMKALVAAGADVNAKNAFESTALLGCATDLAKVRFLIDKGADVNAQSKPGRTALLIAAGYNGGSEIVKLLLDKGAMVSVRDGSGQTPLLSATSANDAATVKLLLDKGADVNLADQAGNGTGAGGQTPLMNASAEANVEIMKMLLAKGAKVNAVSAPKGLDVKNGPIALGLLTPLHFAAASGSGPEPIKLLVDAGANVNALDVRGMTPLMIAVATDRSDPRVVKLLLDKGADPGIKSKLGETASDWAKKFNNPEIMKLVGARPAQASAPLLQPAAESNLPTAKQAAEKSIALLQKTAGSFFAEGGCISCHAQNQAGMAASIARANGIRVDQSTQAEQLKAVKLQWVSADQILMQGMNVPGEMDTMMYSFLQFAEEGVPADRGTDAMIHNLAWQQRTEGNWHFGGLQRPPMEDGDFSRTAMCIRAFVLYAPPGRKAEFDQRIARAAAWLRSATPRTTEDRNMQLLGLKWANADRSSWDSRLKALAALQRPDGGWSQTPDLSSDAYATGTTLFTLHELGTPSSDSVYQRGVDYLLRTQLADGSWHVSSRAPKFQPYFQSGFPYNHDQWISEAATAWATSALSYAASEKPMAASR